MKHKKTEKCKQCELYREMVEAKTNMKDRILKLRGLQSFAVMQNNKIVFEYGDISYNRDYIASCRKSVISILYGMFIGTEYLDKNMKELEINDLQELSENEKMATVRDLLTARSGIYHPASNPTNPIDDGLIPKRDSYKHGEHFAYNNWDFNALGTIFEKLSGKSVYDALNELGKMLDFQDYDVDFNKNMYYERIENEIHTRKSIHNPYHMYLSVRDMLKIGQLMLNKGKYNDKQIITEEWHKTITSICTTVDEIQKQNKKRDVGYGYLWWIFDNDVDHPLHGAYFASGLGGQTIFVIPKHDTIIATKNLANHRKLVYSVLGL